VKAASSAFTTPPGEEVPAGGFVPGPVTETPGPSDAAHEGTDPLDVPELPLVPLPQAANSTAIPAQPTKTAGDIQRVDARGPVWRRLPSRMRITPGYDSRRVEPKLHL
jgi:hypothetical protein